MIRCAFILVVATLALQPPAFHSGVEVVTVDVSVTRADAPVAGLTADERRTLRRLLVRTLEGQARTPSAPSAPSARS